MTRIKLCGLRRLQDITAAGALHPDYIGFVFAPKSRRCISPQEAAVLREALDPDIQTVGVFVDAAPQVIADLLSGGVIDIAQLHGREGPEDILALQQCTGRPIIKAFRIRTEADLEEAARSPADHILLDSGAGTGIRLDWNLLRDFRRPYFLAGGLDPDNVGQAIRTLHPYAVDVSSGIESHGMKDKNKMAAFTAAVRKEDQL